jgi:hypothetical protein
MVSPKLLRSEGGRTFHNRRRRLPSVALAEEGSHACLRALNRAQKALSPSSSSDVHNQNDDDRPGE